MSMNVTKFALPEVIFGRGSLSYAGQCALRLGARKVFLVSDKGVEAAGWVEKLKEVLKKEGLDWFYYSGVTSNPRDYQIEEGAALYRENSADVIVAIGGGSSMDTAKGIAILATNGGRIRDYEGANRVNRALPPMVLITSTAGSGSDISQFCIVTDVERGVKMSIITRTLVPNISIVDPLILQTKSEPLIIRSAIDALAHAIESYCSTISSPFTEMHSLKAIELIIRYLPAAAETRSLDVLEKLSVACVSASMAFSNASLGAEHALAHSLGGRFDIPHGLVHPVLLTAVMRMNIEVGLTKLSDIGSVIIQGRKETARATALAGIERLEEFFNGFGIVTRLSQLIDDEQKSQLEEVCRVAANDVCNLTNPKPATWQDLLTLCKEVWW